MYRHDSLDFPHGSGEDSADRFQAPPIPFRNQGLVPPGRIRFASPAAVGSAGDDPATTTRFLTAMAGDDLAEKRSAIMSLITMADDDAVLRLLINVLDEVPIHAAVIAAVRARAEAKPVSGQPACPVIDTALAWSTWLRSRAVTAPAQARR